jgi:hypothetical protein
MQKLLLFSYQEMQFLQASFSGKRKAGFTGEMEHSFSLQSSYEIIEDEMITDDKFEDDIFADMFGPPPPMEEAPPAKRVRASSVRSEREQFECWALAWCTPAQRQLDHIIYSVLRKKVQITAQEEQQLQQLLEEDEDDVVLH